jgi:hypothetical protein
MYTITITNPTTGEVASREFATASEADNFFLLCGLALAGEFGDEPDAYFDDESEEDYEPDYDECGFNPYMGCYDFDC